MGKKWLSMCLVVLLLVSGATGTVFARDDLYVYYLDVGQAEATLLKGPGFTILIDAGDSGRNDVVEHLEKWHVETIDLFIVTHPHADHIGQGRAVLETFEVAEVWLSGYEHATWLFEDFLDALLESEARYHEPRRGEHFNFGELNLEVLNPSTITTNLHGSNVVVRATYGDVTFLFTGDAERRTERDMLADNLVFEAEILSLGHHGSRTSSSMDFLLAVRPEVAIFSAGQPNSFGHPHEEVINRLAIVEVPMYGTDRNGTIIVWTDGTDYSVYSESGAELVEVGVQNGEYPDPEQGVELNSAGLEDLQRILHIGPARAASIMELRETLPLRSVDDLKWVPGLDTQRIDEIKQQGLAYVKGVMEDQ